MGIVYGAHLKAIGVYMSVFRSLLLLAVFLSGSIASAFAPSPMYYTTNGYRVPVTARFASPSELCNKIKQEFADNNPGRTYSVSSAAYPDGCWINEYGTGGGLLDQKPFNVSLDGASCPANSTKVGADCVCNAGLAEQGGQCVDLNAQCAAKSGQDSIVNFTVGYARTPDSADLDIVGSVNQFPASGELCHQGCKVGASIGGPGVTAWRSQTPTAQGLYRLSMDLPAVQLGTACTADGGSSAPLRPDLPSPTCPGFVGEVNGKPGCYGTANNPVNVVPADRPPVAPVAGNPAAGQKPASGEGSGTGSAGRTPTTGNGGNAGGPASAAVGGAGGGAGGTAASGAGTKPTEDGKEQVACGAPGQPKCGIDESGTPKDYTGKDGLTEWKAAVDSNRAQIKDSGGGVFDGFAVFFSAPPVAACSSFALPNDYGSLDPCPVVDGVRGVMGYIWALGALFLCIGWIREAI